MYKKTNIVRLRKFILGINHYVLALIVIGCVAALCSPLSNTQGYLIVSFVFLFVVSLLATFMGIGPILLVSTIAALVWNFFFIPPRYTFHIGRTEDVLTFCMFFIIALLNGVLTTRVRKQERLARDREETTNALFKLTRELSKTGGVKEILQVARDGVKEHFPGEVYFVLQKGDNQLNALVVNGESQLAPDWDTASWVFRHSQKAGRFTNVFPESEFSYYPLTGTRLNPGVAYTKHELPMSSDKRKFWEALLTQISNALEREFLAGLAQQARILEESDRLYRTLFNSISHELRIPVATVLGASDTLLNSQIRKSDQTALIEEIFVASLRLNRLIENLLNMSRLESGRITPRLDWCDVNDLINKVARDLREDLKPFSLKVAVADDIPLVRLDFGLMEQVVYNLVYNSCEHAPASSDIEIAVGYENDNLFMQVMDRGPGFPADSLKNVFRKFYRVEGSKAGGLGLGLSIVKGFVEAHQGSVWVVNRNGGGAIFTIKIPSPSPKIQSVTE